MRFKAGLLGLIAMTATATAALADCRIMYVTFRLAQNESVSTTGVSTGGSACGTWFRSASLTQFTSASIASRPNNGTLSEVSALRFRYKPKAGFKGVDRYGIRICGRAVGGTGCATVTYNITVQ
jgi:hypothetical protein